MGDVDEEVLGCVGEGAVTDIVEEYGKFGGETLVGSDFHTFLTEDVECSAHKVEGAEHVAEARVHSSGIYEAGEAELLDASGALEEGVVDDREEEWVVDGEEAVVYGVVNDFAFCHVGCWLLAFGCWLLTFGYWRPK